MPDSPKTLQEQLDALAKEYGTYVAVQPIDIDGVRAFNIGHAVPVGHVTGGIVPKDAVEKVGTKAAEAVLPTVNPAK